MTRPKQKPFETLTDSTADWNVMQQRIHMAEWLVQPAMCPCRWTSARPRHMELPFHSDFESTAPAHQSHNFAHAIFPRRPTTREGLINVQPDSGHGSLSIDSSQEAPLTVRLFKWAVLPRGSEQPDVAKQPRSIATGRLLQLHAASSVLLPR